MSLVTPTLPKRICYVGFDQATLAQATSLGSTLGFQTIGVAALCDMIVTGPGVASIKDVLGDRSPDCHGKPSCTWQEFLERFAGAPSIQNGDLNAPVRPWFVDNGTTIDVLGVSLPKFCGQPEHGSYVPAHKSLCFDHPTLSLMHSIALGWASNADLMIEGATASAKTTATLALCAQLGYPAWRVNFGNGSSESELVGRFIPCTQSGGWTWVDGPLVRLMKTTTPNHVLVLDELNLCGSSSLEGKLNSVLDTPGTLTLSEYDFSRYERPESSRIVCTLNIGYVGRNTLSPALVSRFTGICAQTPDEKTMLQQVNWMLTGENPTILHRGIQYQALPESDPVFGNLANDYLPFGASIAKFHHSMAAATGSLSELPATIGRNRRQRYAVSRRQLWALFNTLSVLHKDGVAAKQALRQAIDFTYIACLEEKDRKSAMDIVGACL